MATRPDEFLFLHDSSAGVAPRLLGCELVRMIDGHKLRVKIVETEAYDQSDMASHSFKGRTPRNEVMFGPSGHLYVYFTYGMHHCMNIVTGNEGHGAGVLIRAVEPLEGLDEIERRRGYKRLHELTNGPGKVTQALGVTRQLGGHNLRKEPLQLVVRPALSQEHLVQTTRVGISAAKDMPWRFFIVNNPFVSQPWH